MDHTTLAMTMFIISNCEASRCKVLLSERPFLATCSINLPGPSQKTKTVGLISHPIVVYEYFKATVSISTNSHVRTVSVGFENIRNTKKSIRKQYVGAIGFVFTNAYSAKNYIQRKNDS